MWSSSHPLKSVVKKDFSASDTIDSTGSSNLRQLVQKSSIEDVSKITVSLTVALIGIQEGQTIFRSLITNRSFGVERTNIVPEYMKDEGCFRTPTVKEGGL